MACQALHKIAHFAWHCIAFLLRLKCGAILQAQEHIAHFLLVRIGDYYNIQRICIEANAQFVIKLIVLHACNAVAIHRISFVGR